MSPQRMMGMQLTARLRGLARLVCAVSAERTEASLGSAMMEALPPTLSTSCPGRYCTSAPLLPGMLRGLPAPHMSGNKGLGR